jgi:glycosidase
MSPLLGNHDVVRFMALVDGDMPPGVDEKEVGFTNPPRVDRADSHARMRLAFAFLFSVPGPPTLYYGDEIGMTGAHDPDNRRSMRWQDWSSEETATFEAVSQLAHARGASVALRRGRYEIVAAGEDHLVAARVSPEETVLIAMKAGSGAVTAELPAAWGSPAALEPLVDGGLRASLAGESVEFAGPSQAYGYWIVRW